MNSPSTTRGALQQIVEQPRQLYSLPAVALQVLELTAEPQVDCRQLRACIENDPALTAKILRVVNSSLFGLSRPVGDLAQAVGLLGIKPLTTLVLGFSLPKEMLRGVPGEVLGRYWRHTLIKAVACRELLEQIWHKPGDEAFIAGLLQDIGQLTLIQSLGESYMSFLDRVHAYGGSLRMLESDWLGFDHTIVSARQLEHWRLPKSLVAAVAVPLVTEQILALPKPQQLLPQALHLAELFARLIEQPHGSALTSLLDIGGKYCGLSYAQTQAIFATLQTKVSELAAVFSLDLPGEKSYVDVLLAAHERLSQLTEETVAAPLQTSAQAVLAQVMELGTLASWAATSVPLRQTANDLDPGLPSLVAAAIARARQNRAPLSLVLVEIESYAELVFAHGVERVNEFVQQLQAGLQRLTAEGNRLIQLTDERFALICETCDRADAVARIRALQAELPASVGANDSLSTLSLHIGLATALLPSKNFSPHEFISAAERCLACARLSSGHAVKSIEV